MEMQLSMVVLEVCDVAMVDDPDGNVVLTSDQAARIDNEDNA